MIEFEIGKELCGGITKKHSRNLAFQDNFRRLLAGIRRIEAGLLVMVKDFYKKSRKYFMEIKETLKNPQDVENLWQRCKNDNAKLKNKLSNY
jgi:alanyl-tRNA synthetase